MGQIIYGVKRGFMCNSRIATRYVNKKREKFINEKQDKLGPL